MYIINIIIPIITRLLHLLLRVYDCARLYGIINYTRAFEMV